MQQTEQEYLHTLKVRLSGYVSREDLDDILADYAEHFSIGKSEGRSEEELCRSLGSPDDVAKEIRATYLVKKAEQARSPENIWHAVMATLGLGLFNLAFVLIPFILLIVFLVIIFMVGLVMLVTGPILLLVAVMQLIGFTVPVSWWSSPFEGIFISIVFTIAGVVMVMLDFHLARTFYRLAIRYLKWNIRVIRGGEEAETEEPSPGTTTLSRNGATALDLQLRLGAGEIMIGAGTDETTLMNLTAGDGISTPRYDYSSALYDTVRKVRIRSRHSFSGSWCSDYSLNIWDIRLNREVPVLLDINNKAGRTRLALGELSLSALKIRNGAGETHIDLAGYHGGNFDATIKNGVGSLVIRMPKDSNLKVRIHRGIGDADVRGFMVEGDTYLTRTERPGAPQITCQIRQGVGSIKLEAV
jgi:uncharacterized membrane protein